MRVTSARMYRHPLAGLLALACAMFARPAFADAVSTNADDGYGRIVLTLEPFAHATPAINGGVLTVTFDRKIAIDPNMIAQGLSAYVTTAKADNDGQIFRFALSQSFTLHTSKSANKFAIDLVPQGFTGTPPDLPPPPPVEATAVEVSKLPALAIRAGAYANFARVVFDWQRNVPYAVFAGAGHITVRFEAMARPDFTAFAHVSPPWVKQAGWRAENKGTVVEFDTEASTGYHDFRDGTKIVLDILAPKTDSEAYSPPSSDGAKPKPTRLTAAPAAAATAQARAIADTAAQLKGAITDVQKGDGDSAATPAAAKPATQPPAQTQAANTKPGPAAATPAQTTAVAPANTQTATATQSTPTTQPATPPVQGANAVATKAGAVLVFAKAGGRPAAVFVRGMTAWVVLDGTTPLDPAKLKAALGNFSESVEASSGDGVSILRIALEQPEQITAMALGADLKVTLASQAASIATAISFAHNTDDPTTAKLTTLLPGATHAAQITDPVAGDTLMVIPALAGRAQTEPHRFVEFASLATAQGLVLTPFSDDLNVNVSDSRVTITRPGGLRLSQPPAPPVTTLSALANGDIGPSYMNFVQWGRLANGNFAQAQQTLRANVAKQNPDEANEARLTLAHFYLANGFAAEALGLINMMQASDARLQNDPQLQTMRAAADFMMGRYPDAHNDIAGSAFDNDRHAALWRGLTDAQMDDWDGTRKALNFADPVLRLYPADWQARARLGEAEAALAAKSLELADSYLARLPRDLPAPLMLEAELDRARLYAQEGRLHDAMPLFNAVEAGSDEHMAAEATYYRVDVALAAGALTPAQAIAALNQLRYRWRGDTLELRTLRRVGALYFSQKRWREGLEVLRTASQNFPNNELARQAQDDMRNVFANLYLKGKADSMPPIESLALFYDFVDLTPIGPDGDDMIRRMTDRLVAVDLLEPAAKLLNYQVTKRLDGVARAQVAGRLAMIYLLDRKPKDALAALDSTQMSGLPDDVNHQRLLLQARALASLKQWDQALDLIALDEAPDSRQLRADIYWESGNWEIAGQKSEELLGERWRDQTPLSATDRQMTMRAAIAYSLASDQTSLDRLHDHFNDKMNGADASAFAVVTQNIDSHGIAFRDLASKIASVDTFQNFMKDFRAHYGAVPRS